jgi:hypothetical protein
MNLSNQNECSMGRGVANKKGAVEGKKSEVLEVGEVSPRLPTGG